MYKLFIVDDEPLVREGLRLSIPWEELGFTIVGEAANGLEALKLAEKLKPDVLMTDMRMGVMDGTELIENIVRSYPKMQLVIMTAYNEFSFAKTAIDHNVFAYISKPAPNKEICSIFERLRQKMEQEKSLSEKLQSYNSYRADELFSQIIFSDSIASKQILDLRECLSSDAQQSYFIAQLEIASSEESSERQRQLHLTLNERLDYYASTARECICKCRLSYTQIALLIFTQTHDFDEQTAFLTEIQKEFIAKNGVALTVGVSATFRNLGSIQRAYRQSSEALLQKSHTDTGKVIDFLSVSKLHNQTPTLSSQEIDRIVRGLLAEDKESCIGYLKKHFVILKNINADIRIVKSNMIEICIAVIKALFRNHYTLQLIFGKTVRPSSDLQGLNTLAEISDYTICFLEKLLSCIKVMRPVLLPQSQYRPLVNEAISYILQNYSEKVLISDIADHLHISESRLIHMFKEDTNFTINEFLTQYRIRLAQIMIQNKDYTLYEVSELVGYNNPLTFRKAFHRIVGTIPSKYSVQAGEAHEFS